MILLTCTLFCPAELCVRHVTSRHKMYDFNFKFKFDFELEKVVGWGACLVEGDNGDAVAQLAPAQQRLGSRLAVHHHLNRQCSKHFVMFMYPLCLIIVMAFRDLL
jgi:hypothetical protein